ncbi:MAG TPA: ATP-binding cassette domain-containing protein [Acidimicrobiia bacterium]
MLSIQDLHKTFGDVVALDGCTLSVQRGTMLGFLGPNGAGKTTAMRAVFGLMRPDSGSVTWDGQPIDPDARLRFGYMPEQRGLYPKMRIHDQLVYLGRLRGIGKAQAAESADKWLEILDLTERRDDRLDALSHGNQQRVQMAAALVHDPELLVLDEPFSGLDPIASETMSDILRAQAASGKAVVFSSHQLDLVEDLCEEVAIIDKGTIVVEGSVRELKDQAPIRHLELELDGDASSLFDSLDGVRNMEVEGERYSLVIDAGTDVRGLLNQAESVGRIRHFTYTAPSLTDLFREAVQ